MIQGGFFGVGHGRECGVSPPPKRRGVCHGAACRVALLAMVSHTALMSRLQR